MAQPSTVTASTGPALPNPAGAAGRTRVWTVAAALAAGAGVVAAVLLWRPWPPRNDLSYASFAPVRDAAWAGSLLDGVGFATAAVAFAIAGCLLTRGRGAAFATVGGLLAAAGGLLFALSTFAFATLGWYATATAAVPAEAGTALLAYVEEQPARVLTPSMVGFLLFAVGSLLVAVGLWRGRGVPRWLPAALGVLTVAQFAPWPGRLLDVLQAALMVLLVAVAWFLVRPAAPPR